jgi:hypothetical protein
MLVTVPPRAATDSRRRDAHIKSLTLFLRNGGDRVVCVREVVGTLLLVLPRISQRGPPMSTPKLTGEDVRAFLDRPWHVFDAAHAKHRRETHEADPGAAFRLSEELWEEVRHHGYPDGDRRRRDFEHHVRLRALLDRANLDHQAR